MVCSPTSAAASACAEASDTINCTASRSATRKPRDRRSRVMATNSATARSARPTMGELNENSAIRLRGVR